MKVKTYDEYVAICKEAGAFPLSQQSWTRIRDFFEEPVVDDSAKRKATPIYSGVLKYFPDAIAAVARLSKAGNDKHNPGQPLHWARGKSTDHGDCIVRHQMEPDRLDEETGELHAAAVAWRALAQLQLLEEKRKAVAPATA